MAKDKNYVDLKLGSKSKKAIGIALASVLGISALAGGTYAICKNNGVDWFKPTGNITQSTNGTNTTQFKELNEKLNEYMAKVSLLESEKATLQQTIEEKETAYNELLADANATTEALVNARKELVQLTLDLEAKQAEVDEQKAQIDELNAQIVELQTAYDELQELYTNATLEKSVFEQLLNGTLTTLKIPDGVTTINQHMLASRSVTDLDLNNVTYIGDYALQDMTKLGSLDLKKVTNIGQQQFVASGNEYNQTLTQVVSEKLTRMQYNTFLNCKSLKLINFGKCTKITITGQQTRFSSLGGLSNLTVVKLPQITVSSTNAQNKIFISAKYFEIGNFSHSSTGSLYLQPTSAVTCMRFTGTNIVSYSSINQDDCSNLNNITFYVPDELLEQYKTAEGWVDYADQIKGASEMPEGIDTVEYYKTA